jgi:hypothetical protein
LLLAGDLEDLLEEHRWITCIPEAVDRLANLYPVVKVIQTNRSSRLMIRLGGQGYPETSEFIMENVNLEELVLAYLSLSKSEVELMHIEKNYQEVLP